MDYDIIAVHECCQIAFSWRFFYHYIVCSLKSLSNETFSCGYVECHYKVQQRFGGGQYPPLIDFIIVFPRTNNMSLKSSRLIISLSGSSCHQRLYSHLTVTFQIKFHDSKLLRHSNSFFNSLDPATKMGQYLTSLLLSYHNTCSIHGDTANSC